MSDVRLGIFSKLYLNQATYPSPDFETNEADLISDLSSNAAWDEGESSARRSQVKTFEPTMLALDLSGRLRVDHTDATYGILRDAFLQKTTLDLLVLNGAMTRNGSQGFRYDAKVFGFSEDQAMGNVLFNDITLKPCASDNDPKAVLVTAGAPVYSDIAEEPS